MILGYQVPEFPGSGWVPPVLGTVMYFWGGRPFLTGAINRAEEYPDGDFRRNDPRYQGANYDANVEAARAEM